MNPQLRALAERPIGNRQGIFALVAVALTAATAGLVLTARHPEPPIRDASTVGRSASPPQVAPAAPAPVSGSDVSPAEARTVARRFLAGYLAYLYGHGPADAIQGTTTALRLRLLDQPPRVSPATRKRHPQVQHLQASARASGLRVLATITDGGVASYPIALTVTTNPDGRPVVSDLLGDE